jgi:hypothetical protein
MMAIKEKSLRKIEVNPVYVPSPLKRETYLKRLNSLWILFHGTLQRRDGR